MMAHWPDDTAPPFSRRRDCLGGVLGRQAVTTEPWALEESGGGRSGKEQVKFVSSGVDVLGRLQWGQS